MSLATNHQRNLKALSIEIIEQGGLLTTLNYDPQN
jgi:hypothetical protein